MNEEVLEFDKNGAIDTGKLLEWLPKDLFIGGQWEPGTAARLDVLNPATGQVLASVANATAGDAAEALNRACARSEVANSGGFFFPPTVLSNVSVDSEIVTEEIFGPVVPVVPFNTEEELVEMVNADKIGLGGYIHTSSWERIMRLAERIEIGMIGFNTATISNAGAPFGGVKQSGLGREGSTEGIAEYLETIYIGLPAPRLT